MRGPKKTTNGGAVGRLRNVPEKLKAEESWVLWKREHRDGKPTKVLYQINHRRADSTDPATWTTFEDAVNAYEKDDFFNGVGFVFHPNNPYCGVDIDDATEDQARRWIDLFDSYTELSPSGNGFHIICKAVVPKGTNRDEGELYSSGRFFTMTGDVVRDAPIRETQDAADEFYKFLRRNDQEPTARMSSSNPTLTDAEVVRLAENAKNGDEFSLVYRGGGQFKSGSERDLSLASRLAFWTQDAVQIERIMRGSGCVREKWDRHRTYLRDTIEKALSNVSETYTPPGEKIGDDGGKAPEEGTDSSRPRFERIDLGEPIESGIEPPEMLVPDVLYAGSVHGIYSAGGTGKTFFSLWLIKQVIQQDMPVILLDQENSVRIMSERLRDLGVNAEEVRRNLHYIPSPRMPLSEGAPAEFEELLDEVKPALVVFDSWINFLASAGLDENSSVDIAAWAEAYPQRARIRGIACLILDHIPKEGNTARGSGRKLDYVDAMFELTKSQHFDRETVGRIDLRLKKDREGWLPWGVAFAVGGKDGKLIFGRTTFDNSAVIPETLLPSDRTTLDALKSFGAVGVRDKEWREEAIKRGLSRTTYYRSRGTLLEQGLAEEVMGKYFHKSPAKVESHSVPPESHGTNETAAKGRKSQESHHPKGWDHGTNQAGTSDLWEETL